MKSYFISAFLLFSTISYAQPCSLLTDTFREADKLRSEKEEFQRFRFSENQLDQVQVLPGLDKGITNIRILQKVLDQDFDSYTKNLFWQLDEKLATHRLEEVKKECPETSFKVYEDEIVFYKSKYRAFDPEKDKLVKPN
ncbi:hypothetical protein L0657_04130 [Dyadobacter sp. CY345]|uniref:hypothetical protein n=1 Tax=Dyadobacter sp. CY345 TaxID=2909335 RepID=UPI001F2E5B77|nr:hypothetical protein [Dyadobacter sp. CY345]MCF2443136.1 hypothetical protein [Dyadobacter sp. CY345]